MQRTDPTNGGEYKVTSERAGRGGATDKGGAPPQRSATISGNEAERAIRERYLARHSPLFSGGGGALGAGPHPPPHHGHHALNPYVQVLPSSWHHPNMDVRQSSIMLTPDSPTVQPDDFRLRASSFRGSTGPDPGPYPPGPLFSHYKSSAPPSSAATMFGNHPEPQFR
jgi:hypothetical protein